ELLLGQLFLPLLFALGQRRRVEGGRGLALQALRFLDGLHVLLLGPRTGRRYHQEDRGGRRSHHVYFMERGTPLPYSSMKNEPLRTAPGVVSWGRSVSWTSTSHATAGFLS